MVGVYNLVGNRKEQRRCSVPPVAQRAGGNGCGGPEEKNVFNILFTFLRGTARILNKSGAPRLSITPGFHGSIGGFKWASRRPPRLAAYLNFCLFLKTLFREAAFFQGGPREKVLWKLRFLVSFFSFYRLFRRSFGSPCLLKN